MLKKGLLNVWLLAICVLVPFTIANAQTAYQSNEEATIIKAGYDCCECDEPCDCEEPCDCDACECDSCDSSDYAPNYYYSYPYGYGDYGCNPYSGYYYSW